MLTLEHYLGDGSLGTRLLHSMMEGPTTIVKAANLYLLSLKYKHPCKLCMCQSDFFNISFGDFAYCLSLIMYVIVIILKFCNSFLKTGMYFCLHILNTQLSCNMPYL